MAAVVVCCGMLWCVVALYMYVCCGSVYVCVLCGMLWLWLCMFVEWCVGARCMCVCCMLWLHVGMCCVIYVVALCTYVCCVLCGVLWLGVCMGMCVQDCVHVQCASAFHACICAGVHVSDSRH